MFEVESELTMPRWSRYAGQPIDVTSRRSIVIDSPANDAAPPHRNAREIVVDNFYHAGQFWRAVIPLDSVENVFGQAFNFSPVRTRKRKGQIETVVDKHGLPKYRIPVLNHVQVRFTLQASHSAKVFPLGADVTGNPVHLIHDFVYSLEILGPAGVSFNLRDGLSGNLLSAHRFLSTQEMVFERLVVENQYVTQSPPLPLSASEKRELLVQSLLRSHRAGLSEAYYLYRLCGTNNCTSSPFNILDSVVKYRWPHRWGALLYRLPLSPRFYLRVRGLDSDPAQRTLVRSEFADYIDDAATQDRKREHVRQLVAIRRAVRDSDGDPKREEAPPEEQ